MQVIIWRLVSLELGILEREREGRREGTVGSHHNVAPHLLRFFLQRVTSTELKRMQWSDVIWIKHWWNYIRFSSLSALELCIAWLSIHQSVCNTGLSDALLIKNSMNDVVTHFSLCLLLHVAEAGTPSQNNSFIAYSQLICQFFSTAELSSTSLLKMQ